jgi:uncharacterized protein YbjT (DUF2867 family)
VGQESAIGADASPRVFYNHVDGLLEDALKQMPFEYIVLARPSLWVGEREVTGEPRRVG